MNCSLQWHQCKACHCPQRGQIIAVRWITDMLCKRCCADWKWTVTAERIFPCHHLCKHWRVWDDNSRGATVTHFMGITKQGFRLDFCSLSGFPVHNANSMKAIIMQLLTFSLLTMVARPHAYLFSYTKNMHMYIHLCTSRCCLFHSFRKNKLVSVQIGWFQHK